MFYYLLTNNKVIKMEELREVLKENQKNLIKNKERLEKINKEIKQNSDLAVSILIALTIYGICDFASQIIY